MEINNVSKGSQKRLVAFKVKIRDILDGKYIKEDGWLPNYILTGAGQRLSRVNIIGTVIDKSNSENYRNIELDDGSGTISVRSFEENNLFNKIEIGQGVLVVGRVRGVGSLVYVVPEIIKKIDNKKWIELRKLELEKIEKENPKKVIDLEAGMEAGDVETKKEGAGLSSKIYNLIKELDDGGGADIHIIIEKANNLNAEKIINNLLQEGEIFEIKPGKLKILE